MFRGTERIYAPLAHDVQDVDDVQDRRSDHFFSPAKAKRRAGITIPHTQRANGPAIAKPSVDTIKLQTQR